jgi:alpha/beta superfamily hydrolase
MGGQSTQLETVDGLVLDAVLDAPSAPVGAAVVAHPHPLYGGSKENPVVAAIADGLVDAGLVTVRFDFRGVGRSEGEHGGGVDERLDLTAAIDAVAPFAGDGPLVVAGYSFGAAVALSVADPRASGWLLVAPPLGNPRVSSGPVLASGDHRRKKLLVPEHDQFATPAVVHDVVAGWPAVEGAVAPDADHFLMGRAAFVRDWAKGAALSW